MPLFQTIRETARSTDARLIVIDNIAQCFAGNENIRAQGRRMKRAGGI